MYQAITNDIKVTVVPRYNMRMSRPSSSEYLFSYQITIENLSNITCQLISREWHIKDGYGNHRFVEGEGVVGQKPILHPGESHTYASYCPISTPIGYMMGFFRMNDLTIGDRMFDIEVPRFDFIAYPIQN